MYPEVHIGYLTFYSYGLMIGIAITAVVAVLQVDFSRRLIPIPVIRMCLIAALCGVVGSKVDNSLVRHWKNGLPFFDGSPLHWLATGHTFLGAEFGVMAAIAAIARIYGQPFLLVLDAWPVMSLGCAIGRLGCFLAGDGDYGPSTTMPWGIAFPHGIVPTNAHVHPTMLYISAYELGIFLYLWPKGRRNRYFKHARGFLLGQALLLSSGGRILSEMISLNPHVLWGLTEAQIVAAILFAVGLGLQILLYRPRLPRNTRASSLLVRTP